LKQCCLILALDLMLKPHHVIDLNVTRGESSIAFPEFHLIVIDEYKRDDAECFGYRPGVLCLH
jgi:hypothetical protein